MSRLRQYNFSLEALKGHSKWPKFSPNEIDEEIIDLAEEIRGDDEIGGHHVAQIMRNQHGIKISEKNIRRENQLKLSHISPDLTITK